MLKVLSLLPLAQVLVPMAAIATPVLSSPTFSLPTATDVTSTQAAPSLSDRPRSLLAETLPELSSGLDNTPNPAGSPPTVIPNSDSLIRVLPRLDVTRPQLVQALPGHLDDVPVFNSNSPELIQKSGILLSTFPPDGMQVREAHLNYALKGRFDIFAHHVAKGLTADDVRTLYLGILMYNPAEQPIKIDLLQGVTYLSQDAPFNNLPDYVANPMGQVFAGPGSRVTNDVLRGERQPQWPNQITIPAKSAQMLTNLPIPLRRLTVATDGTLPPGSIIPGLPATALTPQLQNTGSLLAPAIAMASTRNATLAISPPPRSFATSSSASDDGRPLPINGRSVLMRLSSNGPVYLASMAMYAPQTMSGEERVPSLAEWITLLRSSSVAGPRDRQPTPPDSRFVPRFLYGRVAGVAKGSQWSGKATDKNSNSLSIPNPGDAISYVISSVDRNTFGTGQIQSAPMLVRYPDTAYRAHGNYGVLYSITLPLKNNTDSTQRVGIMLQTPLQDERLQGEALLFRNPPYDQIFFRGTVRLRYVDDLGIRQTRYMHLVQRRGQQGEPLIRLTLPKGTERQVEVQLIYPPDATPPQVLTVKTQSYNGLAAVPQNPAVGQSAAGESNPVNQPR